MSNKRVTELPLVVDVADEDFFILVDLSEPNLELRTKKLDYLLLKSSIKSYLQPDLDLKANLASPDLTGTPTAPTATQNNNSTQVATTAYVDNIKNRDNHTGTQLAATVSDFSSSVDARITLQKSAINGLAVLDGSGKVPATQLPSYVDDAVEFADYASLPIVGEVSKIFVTLNDNRAFRWGGSTYIEISPSPSSTDSIAEGSINKYYTESRVTANSTVAANTSKLLGIAADATANDTDANLRSRATHTGTQLASTISDLSKSSVGLGNVDNVADINKPVSSPTQTALNLKASLISPTFTGTPNAPTAATGTNTAQLATTAFVKSAVEAVSPSYSMTTLDIDWSLIRDVFYRDISVDSTITISNIVDGKSISVILTNPTGLPVEITIANVYRDASAIIIAANTTSILSFKYANNNMYMTKESGLVLVP